MPPGELLELADRRRQHQFERAVPIIIIGVSSRARIESTDQQFSSGEQSSSTMVNFSVIHAAPGRGEHRPSRPIIEGSDNAVVLEGENVDPGQRCREFESLRSIPAT